jgi:DNA modification methylase
MNIQKMKINKIKPADYNPRKNLKPGDSEYEKIKRSLLDFGFVEPLIWNEQTQTLIGGHQRLTILQELGYDEVDVVVVHFNKDKERALNIALNKIQGEWDKEKLAALITELQIIPDFDVSITGFDNYEISNLLDGFNDNGEDDFNVESAVAAIETSVTQPGDLIKLGEHRILCGDSSCKDTVSRLLSDNKINLIYTDPQYNVDYSSDDRPHAKSRSKKSKSWKRICSDDMRQEEYEVWLQEIFATCIPHLSAGACFYVWNGHKQFGPMHQMLTLMGCRISCIITWVKERFAFSYGDYHQQSEFFLYGWREDNGAHRWYGPTNESTVWQIHRDAAKNYIHPTQKPIALAQRAIRNSSLRGDIVFDAFLGSGSTLIASESLQRRCYGLEIDPKYCDAIVQRYVSYVGRNKISPEILAKYIKEVPHAVR